MVATIVRAPGARSTDGVTCHVWSGWTTVVSGVAPSILTLTSVPAAAVVVPTIVGVVSLVDLVAPPLTAMAGPTRSTVKVWARTLAPSPLVAVTVTGCGPFASSKVVVADQKVSFWVTVTVTPSPDPISTAIVEPVSTVPVITGVESFVRALFVIAKTVSMVKTWVSVAVLPARSLTSATMVHSPPVMPLGVAFHDWSA